MMAMLSKDIVHTIYRLIHNDYIKALNKQYHNKFKVVLVSLTEGDQFHGLFMRDSPYAPFNYRYMDKYKYKCIYRYTKKSGIWEPVAKLPKHYFSYSFLCI